MDLAKARRNLQAECDDLSILSATLGVVCDDLEVVRSEEISLLAAHAIEIMAWVRQLERNALHSEVKKILRDCSFSLRGQHQPRDNEPWLRAWL